MKKQITYLPQLENKTVENIQFIENDLYLFFKKDYFVKFSINQNFIDIGDEIDISEYVKQSVNGVYGNSDVTIKIPKFVKMLISMKVIDEKSFMERVETLKENYERLGLERERVTYERLKLKFEN